MGHWTKSLFALVAPMLLTGCLWGPGKFTSDLTLKKDGSFVLDYKGEIVLQLPPDDKKTPPWQDGMARCRKSGATEIPPESSTGEGDDDDPLIPCSASQIAQMKAQYERKAADDRKQSEDMAKAFGLPGLDDESNRAFAAKISKYAGWRSVTYRGNGVYDVDYHFEGRATQDFIFPAIPDDNFLIPFIALRRRADGSVLVTAPAFAGGAGPFAPAAGSASAALASGGPPPSRAEGRFTLQTDGEILTNNSEDGAAPAPGGRAIHWDVAPSNSKIPEALVGLR